MRLKETIAWNPDDNRSQDDQCKCGLGINQRTGRLQWCPASTCRRILIFLPAVMLPIVLVLVFLTQFANGAIVPKITRNDVVYTFGNRIEPKFDQENWQRDPRCISVQYGLSETVDVEERDLLKDVRTAFIPPDSVIVPPNCLEHEQLPSSIRAQLAEAEDFFFDLISRQRRSFPELNATNINANGDVSEIGDDNSNINIHWRKTPSGPRSRSAENDESGAGSNEVGNPVGFNSFWENEGSRQNIRATQAEIMKSYMDTSVDPCDDFYQYACGNWEKLNPIPKDKAGYDTFEMLRESLDVVLRNLLTEKSNLKLKFDNNSSNQKEPESLQNVQELTSISSADSFDSKLRNNLAAVRLRRQILQQRDVFENLLKRYQRFKRVMRTKRQLANLSNSSIRAVGRHNINAEIKVKYLYASCMNSELLQKRGNQPLIKLLQDLGGWPVLEENWRADQFKWMNLTARLRVYNNDIFIVQWVGPDIRNSDENVIQLDQTSLGLPTRDYFLLESNAPYLAAYKNFMRTIMTLLGAPEERAKTVADQVVYFEKELAKITSSSEDRANVSVLYKRMTLQGLHNQVPQIDWVQYLSVVQDREVRPSETVVIYAVEYMRNLVQLIARSDKRTVANYLLWRFVRHRINNLDDRFVEPKQKFFQALFGREKSPPRWKNCVGQVNSNMGMALGAMFVRRYFDENSKEDTMQMTHELQQAFREILNSTDWLDPSTKELAAQKVNSMSLKIGYPDFILSKQELNKKYVGLEIHPDMYFENTLNVLKHVARSEQHKLGERVNKTVWQTAPAIVNAYYSRNKNQIMFPAGILQPPFYHRHFPRSLNYGGIGVVIGHELTHGFDDKGRLFDREGNIHKWWSDYAINGFHQRARCLISQYGNYTVTEVGMQIDGESTQGENIADNGGIRQAFHAYKNWLSRNSNADLEESETLPGFNMSGSQLFFLNFAQVWCGAMRPEATRNKLKTAVHSPGKFRVIGTLSNSNDFAQEFNCPVGSPMNPRHKCSVW